ncbi:MAG: S41 family peptidase [Candidatus Thioglobus sp.]|nr:MAG: S41 family peptidase [Candidatus Thioglobus sp.]
MNKFLKDLEGFTSAYSKIKKLYVEEVDNKKLFVDAIKGMVGGLDPHSVYLDPKEQKNLMETTSGKFGGLGIVITKKDDAIEVISPIDDTPAYKAGIQAGDKIIKINNKPVRGMTLEDGVNMMRGKPNTDIKITILRKNKKPFEVKITRQIITIISVKGYLLEDGVGYVRISSFQRPTIGLLKKTIKRLKDENDGDLNSLILDLRNNPGGLLNGAVSVADLFLDDTGLIVYTKGRIKGSNTEFASTAGDTLSAKPMVVLINKGSASASEIVAGALQDYKRAVIMGNTSFGKGSVQTILQLKGGYGLKVTTAKYYTPNGRSIQAKGINPDIKLQNIKLEKEEKESIISTKESDLDGHLEVEELGEQSTEQILDEQNSKKTEANKKAIAKLKQDYFVLQARNLLKALTVLKK